MRLAGPRGRARACGAQLPARAEAVRAHAARRTRSTDAPGAGERVPQRGPEIARALVAGERRQRRGRADRRSPAAPARARRALRPRARRGSSPCRRPACRAARAPAFPLPWWRRRWCRATRPGALRAAPAPRPAGAEPPRRIDSPLSSRTPVPSTRSPGANASSRAPEKPEEITRRGRSSTSARRAPPPRPIARATASAPPIRPWMRLPRIGAPRARAALRSSISSPTTTSTGRASCQSPHAGVSRGSILPLRRSQISCDLRAASSPVSAMSATSARSTRNRCVAASSNISMCEAPRS